MDEEAKNSVEKPVSTLTPLKALIGVIAIFFGAQIVAVNLVAIGGLLFGQDPNDIAALIGDNILVQALTLIVVVLLGVVAVNWLLKMTKTTWKSIGLVRPEAKDVLKAILGYGWYMLLFFGIMTIVGQYLTGVDLDQQQQLGFDRQTESAGALVLIGISLVVLPAFYEELLMRGVLFSGMRKKFSFLVTAVIVSVIFGAAHLEWIGDAPLNWAAAIDTAILAIVLVYLREKSKSLWPAIFLHGIKNLVAFTFVFVLKLA